MTTTTDLHTAAIAQRPNDTQKATLSCNHRMFVPADVQVGGRVRCERCETSRTGDDAKARTRRVKKLAPATPLATDAIAEVTARAPEVVTTPAPVSTPLRQAYVAAADRAERVKLAKAEHAAIAAWTKAGEQGDRPATPNLDAIREGTVTNVGASPRPAGTPRKVNARRAAAMVRKAAKDRTPVKVTPEQLADYLRALASTEGVGTWNDELEVAYWTEGYAVSRPRWQAAVAEVTDSDYNGSATPGQEG